MSDIFLERSDTTEVTSPSNTGPSQPNHLPPRHWKKPIARFAIFSFLGIIAFGLIFLLITSWRLPAVDTLQNYQPAVGTEVFSIDKVKIGEFFRQRRVYLSESDIPDRVKQAFIAAEDAQYYDHSGISVSGIMRAFVKNMLAGRVKQGGSTITQQVAKSLLLSSERSIMRKIKEAMLAFKMENFLTKAQILEIYLNEIYLGDGAYGIEAAAQTYFGKNTTDLDLAEIAMIAGLTRAPSRDNPRRSLAAAKEKQRYVLERMREEGYISKDEEQAALKFDIKLNRFRDLNLKYAPYFVEHIRRYLTKNYGDDLVLEKGLQVYTTIEAKAALAADRALKEGVESVDRHQGYRGPIKHVAESEWENAIIEIEELNPVKLEDRETYHALVTKVDDDKKEVLIDLGRQREGQILLEDMEWARKPNPDRYWAYQKIKKPSQALKAGDIIYVHRYDANRYALTQTSQVQGALIAIDPISGHIKAMVGGYDFKASEFNRTVQAKRQPGSAFKPIVFSAALEKGYTAASVITDSPIVYDDPALQATWKPKNYAGKFHGDTIFRNCLIQSRNVPTIKIVQDIGVDYLISHAKKIGIRSDLQPNLSLALGTSVLSPIEIVRAYSVFAAQGRRPTEENDFILAVFDQNGQLLEKNTPVELSPNSNFIENTALLVSDMAEADYAEALKAGIDPETPLPESYAISPQMAAIMTHLLGEVITSGTGSKARDINRPAAGKTGTTNENHDAWFVGYTPELVTAVWIGFDDSNRSLGVKEDGGQIASPVWLSFMKEALADKPTQSFPRPPGLITVRIDSETGMLADDSTKKVISELFLEGTEPSTTSEEEKIQKSDSSNFFLEE